jgi:hypothetical protein
MFDFEKTPITQYQNFIDILQKAWARFIKKNVGVVDKLCGNYIKTDFPV